MADAFIGVFRTSADVFVSLTTGIIPLIVVFLTAVNALVKFIGEDKVENFAKWAAQEGWMYVPVRYTLLPFVAVFMLTNPEKNKPAFYDAAVSFVHPITGIFPHANGGELFVWLGIAAGVEIAAPELVTPLAVRYLLAGLVVILIRGVTTDIIYSIMSSRKVGAE
jgi:PTS system glucitol/sorbitol-specific IIC component